MPADFETPALAFVWPFCPSNRFPVLREALLLGTVSGAHYIECVLLCPLESRTCDWLYSRPEPSGLHRAVNLPDRVTLGEVCSWTFQRHSQALDLYPSGYGVIQSVTHTDNRAGTHSNRHQSSQDTVSLKMSCLSFGTGQSVSLKQEDTRCQAC